MIYYAVAVVVFALDRLSKWVIVDRMDIGGSKEIIGEFFQIVSHRNKGAAFGILQNQRWFFIVITVIILVGLIWYMRRSIKQKHVLLPFGLSMILGGALGNFIDRLLHGEVVDFLQFYFHFTALGVNVDYIYPIFNLADSAIFVGVALILIDAFIVWRKEKRSASHEPV